MINQGVARAFARVRKRGVLTFAAISEVGVGGRRVDGGHRLNSQSHGTHPKRTHGPLGCLLLPSTLFLAGSSALWFSGSGA